MARKQGELQIDPDPNDPDFDWDRVKWYLAVLDEAAAGAAEAMRGEEDGDPHNGTAMSLNDAMFLNNGRPIVEVRDYLNRAKEALEKIEHHFRRVEVAHEYAGYQITRRTSEP
jgi:hypothetical protein